MLLRKILFGVTSVAYAVLFIFSKYLESEYDKHTQDRFDPDVVIPSIRFCCKKVTTCNEEFIRENFNEENPRNSDESSIISNSTKFEIILGAPKCTLSEDKLDYAVIVSWIALNIHCFYSHNSMYC